MIETQRLILRGWREADKLPFRAMGRDPAVMRHLSPLQDDATSDAAFPRQQALEERLGHCFWAVERRDDGAFLGFCGIKPGPEGTPIEGELEIGWRIASPYWRQGYALEAAQASLNWCWVNHHAPSVAAITVVDNAASRGLMERLGMTRVMDGDFDHPALAEGDPLRRHVLYRIQRP